MTVARRFGRLLGAIAVTALLCTQCNRAQCEDLRDKLSAEQQSWQKCERDVDCIKVFGNPRDCTGIMSCDFAVNRTHRLEAERRVASLPEETLDCFQCTSPNCVDGKIAVCEPVSGLCILVTDLVDGGVSQGQGERPPVPEEDAGGHATPLDAGPG